MNYIIKNSLLYFGHGNMEKMDIWIKDEQIVAVQPNIVTRSDIDVIDAYGYIAFPGLIYDASFSSYTRNNDRYKNQMLELMNKGYTTIVDVIRWDHNLSFEQMIMQARLLHSDSPLDYSFHILMPISILKPSIINLISQYHIRQITIETKDIRDFMGIDWESIFVASKKYGISLKLMPHTSYIDSKIGKKIVAELTNYWYYLNTKYGRYPLIIDRGRLFSKSRAQKNVEYTPDSIRESTIFPAKAAGIYPLKGSIAVSSDADLIFVASDLIKSKKLIIPSFIVNRGVFYTTPILTLPVTQGTQIKTSHSHLL